MLTGRKLLLADDSLTIQKVVSLTFGDEEMEVTTVGSGAGALEHLGESLPDIVLADVFMPEPNGYVLCERIKRDERTRHIPVVLLVGTFEPFNEAEARRVGADEVLTKPFQSIRDLVNKVGGLLGGQPDEKRTDATDASRERQQEETTRDLSPYANDARAADPAPAAPPDAFADFDMDDSTIQTTPAAAFDARQQQQHTAAPDFSEIKEEEQFSDRGETAEAFVLDDDAPVMPDREDILSDDDSILADDVAHDAPHVHAQDVQAATTAATSQAESHATHAASSFNESAFDVHAARSAESDTESAFNSYASRAAEADDALLDIGDVTPARNASAEADDFILDIGDEDSFDSFDSSTAAAFTPDADVLAPDAAHDAATAETDLFFAEHAPASVAPQALSTPDAFADSEASAASHVSAQSSAPEETSLFGDSMSAPPSPPAFTEADAAPAPHVEATLDLRAPEITESPALLFANEPVAGGQESEPPPGIEGVSHEPTWDGDPVAASIVAHAGDAAATAEAFDDERTVEWSESRAAETIVADASSATADASLTEGAHAAVSHAASYESSRAVESSQAVASSESNQAASSTAASLSPEMLEEVVRRVVAQMSEQVVREIAWEVVPELAERLIKQRLEEEERTRTH